MAHVMIVDDDEDFAAAAATALKAAGHEVEIQTDTTEALTKMKQSKPELIVLDVMFPEDAAAGFDLARVLRQASEHLKHVPVLMLTAVNTRFPLGFSTRDIDDDWLPVSDFLEKPVDLELLVSKVDDLLKRAESKQSEG